MYTITYSFNINVNISFDLVKWAAITAMVSLPAETKDIGNNSETIATTDTIRMTDDQKTNPNEDGNRQ